MMKKLYLAFLSVLLLTVSHGALAATQANVALGGFHQVLTYTPTTKSPLGGRSLLIVLHGCAQAHSAFAGAKLGDAADAYGMVVAVPDAVTKAGMACWDYWGLPPTRTLNDYGRLINLAKALVQNPDLEIDPNQVYISGLSSGGTFAMETACVAPDIFAGMGLVGAPSAGTGMGGAFGFEGSIESTRASCWNTAGAAYQSHFATQVTVSAYGTGDFTVNKGYGPQNAGAMARIYGHSDPSVDYPVDRAKALINTEKTVLLLELTGEGHTWPGGPGASGSFIGNASLNFATFLGKFFNENNRRVADVNNPPTVNVTATAAGVNILVTGSATDSDGTIASATIELRNTKTDTTVKGPSPLTISSGQFSYNGFTDLGNGSYEVIVKAKDDKGAEGSGKATVQITAGQDMFCPSVTGLRDSFSSALVVEGTSFFTKSYTTTGDDQALTSTTQQYTIYIGNNGKGYLTDPEDCPPPVVKEYTVTATAGAGGSITPPSRKVEEGKSATFTVTPNSGYVIANVTGCGGLLSGSTYTISSVTSNCTVNATFTQSVVNYTVTATAGTGGQVSPATQQVQSGQSATVQVTANSGYSIANVTGCGGSLSGSTFVIPSVTSNCTVNATFTQSVVNYTVTATAGVGGKVSPATQQVQGGQGAVVQVTANNGYTIANVTGCGGSLSGSAFVIPAVNADCTVSATFKAIPDTYYTVTATAGTGGKISPASQSVKSGEGTTVQVSANSGYTVANVTGCGGSLSGATYVIPSVTSNCTVNATFTASVVNYTVTATAGAGGKVSPATQQVKSGQSATVQVTPNSGYKINSVSGCSGNLNGSIYTISSVTADCSVHATFVADIVEYTVTARAGTGGTVSPTSQKVNSGAGATVQISADSGYTIASVTGCGGNLSGATYVIPSVTANCTVNASFVKDSVPTYTVSASVSGTGGSVNPTSQKVAAGGQAAVTVTPSSGYEIADVTGCGGVLNGTLYQIASVNSNCAVTATFNKLPVNHTVKASAGAGGSVSPATQVVADGASAAVNVTPNAGYTVGTVTGCGGILTGNTYFIQSVTASCTVNASFNPPGVKTHTLDLNFGQGGSVDITPSAKITEVSSGSNSGTWSVVKGSEVKFTIATEADYKIDQIDSSCSYNFDADAKVENFVISSIDSDCSVNVTFVHTGSGLPDEVDLGGATSPVVIALGLALVALRRRRKAA